MRRPDRLAFWLLAAIALVAPAAFADSAQSEMVLFSAPCGLSFLRPAGWDLEPGPDHVCHVSLSDPLHDLSEIRISVIAPCRFEIDPGKAGFTWLYGRWMIEDMPETWLPADSVPHPLMWGQKAMVTRRCYGESGYSGQCEAHYAILGDEHGRCIVMEGGPGSYEVFERILLSTRLPYREFKTTMVFDSLLVHEHGPARVIAGLREPDPTLWNVFLDSVAAGDFIAVNIAVQLAPGATGEAAAELAHAVRRGFVAGNAYILEHIPDVFPFEAICRPPDTLSGDAREAWVSSAEAVLVTYETESNASADLVQTCREHLRGTR